MSSKEPAKSKKVIIRLYRQFDIDLIYAFHIIKSEKCELQTWIKDILRSYMDGTFKPGRKTELSDKILYAKYSGKLILPKKVQYHILLDSETDSDIAEWLETITIGYRNAVIKSILRGRIGYPVTYPCLVSTDVYFKGKDDEGVVKLLNDGLKKQSMQEDTDNV